MLRLLNDKWETCVRARTVLEREAEVVERLVEAMVQGLLGFPYQRLYLDAPTTMFRALQTEGDVRWAPDPWAYPIPSPDEDLGGWCMDYPPQHAHDMYLRCDALSDHYHDEVRMASRVAACCSPVEAWRDPECARGIVHRAIAFARAARKPVVDTRCMREGVYKATRSCTQFKPSFTLKLCRLLDATVVLDPCAGWGDRAIGAAAAGVRTYYGVDPNPRLQEGYERIRTELVPADFDYQFWCGPFEEYTHTQKPPDLVFTSPPFHAYEQYDTGGGEQGAAQQSSARHPDFEAWVVRWLLPAVDKMCGLLRPGGHLALYLCDTGEHYRYEDRVVEHIRDRHGTAMRLRGRIGCGAYQKPLRVWQKKDGT